MSAHCDNLGYKGIAHWLRIQAKEELAHATHLFDYILMRGNKPDFPAITTPATEFTSILDLFEDILKHEQYITSEVNKIAKAALKDDDHATYNFIQWYVNEQVEEESSVELLIQKIKLFGTNTSLLFYLDAELGKRVYVDPFAKQY